jgi:hypothetical protein
LLVRGPNSEGVTRLWKRRDAWLKKHAKTVDDLRGKVDFYPEPIPLNASEAYSDTLITYAKEHDYALIVIDTWRRPTRARTRTRSVSCSSR